jgi:hypothetical protein
MPTKTITTNDARLLLRQPAVVDKLNVPDIPTREIVRKASTRSISIAVVLVTLGAVFWMNASSLVAILTTPDRLERLEEAVAHCHEDKTRLETEIQTLRNRVVDLERQLNFKP